jgi:hypothetical protein
MQTWELRKEFEGLSGTEWENEQGEPYIEYVRWLEDQIVLLRVKLGT